MELLFKNLLPKDVKLFVEEVARKTSGYDVYLGGGCLRDIYYNAINHFGSKDCWNYFYMDRGVEDQPLQPKDLDIFFIPQSDDITKELPILAKTYINYDIPAQDIPNVRENVFHVRGLFKKDLSVRDIQFIAYDKPMGINSLAEDMDTSVNQVMYHPLTETQYMTEEFKLSHDNKVIKMLHEFETERMYSRIQRMMKKFPDYKVEHNISDEDWDYCVYKETADKKAKKRGKSTGSFISD